MISVTVFAFATDHESVVLAPGSIWTVLPVGPPDQWLRAAWKDDGTAKYNVKKILHDLLDGIPDPDPLGPYSALDVKVTTRGLQAF